MISKRIGTSQHRVGNKLPTLRILYGQRGSQTRFAIRRRCHYTNDMSTVPDKAEQVRQMHAGLIHRVVIACQNRQLVPDLDAVLKTALDNDWVQLVAAIRRILDGTRDMKLLSGLDEEDSIIIESILRGLQNPQTLPPLDAGPDATHAAPGLAALIHAARRGDAETLSTLANMATAMSQAGGDMARLAAVMRPLIEGEREPDKLTKGMSAQGESLVLAILGELGKLEAH